MAVESVYCFIIPDSWPTTAPRCRCPWAKAHCHSHSLIKCQSHATAGYQLASTWCCCRCHIMIPLPTFCIIQRRLQLPEFNLDSERSGKAMTNGVGLSFHRLVWFFSLIWRHVWSLMKWSHFLDTGDISSGDIWTAKSRWRPASPITHMENIGLINIFPFAPFTIWRPLRGYSLEAFPHAG